jgi:hypothetical protein
VTLFILSMVLAAASTLWVVHPIFARKRALLADVERADVLDAESRKSVALSSLREIEYDREAGKLDDVDYRALQSQLTAEALQAIRIADQVHAPENDARHSCGFRGPPGSRFCGGCGTRLA